MKLDTGAFVSKTMTVLILMTVLLNSCASAHPAFPFDPPGDALDVTYQTGPDIKSNEQLAFWIKNKSSDCIIFPIGFGVSIFIEYNGSWSQIKDLMKVKSESKEIILRETSDVFSENIVVIKPDLSSTELVAKTNFKAVIVGKLCSDEDVIVEKTIPFTVSP